MAGFKVSTNKAQPNAAPSVFFADYRLQLLKKLTCRARNINPARHSALAIFHALHDTGLFPALRAVGGFRGVHDFLTVGCLCDLCHSGSPDRNVRRPEGAAVLPGSW